MSSKIEFTRLNAIIIDDEFDGRENLKKIIENFCPEVEILGVADSVVNGNKLVGAHKPDVVFLDVNMPVLDGFDFLDDYDEPDFTVVIVSAHEEHGIKALKAGAVDYLLKPISIKELKKTVKKLLNIYNKKYKEASIENDKILIPTSHGFDVLSFDNIIRLEADTSYTKVITVDGKSVIVSRTLKDFEDILLQNNFFRTHKSYLINLKYVKKYSNNDGCFVVMADGCKVDISRRKATEFNQRIKTMLNAV